MFEHELHRKVDRILDNQALLIGLLRRALFALNVIVKQERIEMAAIDDLQTQVTAQGDVIQSAITLIQGLAAMIEAAGTDGAKLASIVATLKSQDDALAAAVAANTPAQPPAPPAPPPSDTPPSDGGTTPPTDGGTASDGGTTPPTDGGTTPPA